MTPAEQVALQQGVNLGPCTRAIEAHMRAMLGEIVKVKLDAQGCLFADGQPTSLPALRERLAALAGQRCGVLYFRENPTTFGPPIVGEAMQAICAAGFPIVIFTEDFESSA